MRLICTTLAGMGMLLSATAQHPISLPNASNQFITSVNISWAADTRSWVAFENARLVNGSNIYDYLINKATAGKLKVGTERWADFAGVSNDPLTSSPYTKMVATRQPPVPIEDRDAQKRLVLHEIIYLKNYQLQSTVIAVAPLANVFTSLGINIGQKGCFFCCGENKPQQLDKKHTGWVLLQSVQRRINPDSSIAENMQLLKQSFGMSLSQALLFGTTQNSTQLTDIIAKKDIAPKEILGYNYKAKVEVPVYDSTGQLTGYTMIAPAPIFPNGLCNYIEITQDIYFNPTQNTFHTEIRECYLFVKAWNLSGEVIADEKRFRLVFR